MPCPSHLILPDGTVHELQGSCIFGRHAGNDVELANDHVSRQHALIQWQIGQNQTGEGEFLLVDLGSSNGTCLNGRRISKPVPLKDGDIIDLAGSQVVFRSDSEEVQAVTVGSTLIDIKKRDCWLMVADIVGSTRRSQELSPEEIPRINGDWFKSCRELVEDHGGHMNQFLGDGIFCYWDYTQEAKERIPALLRHFHRIQPQSSPPFRVVLHFGLVVLGSVPTLSSLNLHGPNVNFVFRLEKLAASLGEGILLSAEASDELALAVRSSHHAELSGFNGLFRFDVPDWAE